MGNSTPCKIVPPKISPWNFAHVITSARLPTTHILVLVGPQIGEILPLCDFFDCPVLTFFSILRPAPTAGLIFTLYGSNDVLPHTDGPFGVRTIVDHIWGNMLLKPPKWAWICNFKPKRQNMNIAIFPKLRIGWRPNLRIKLRPAIALRGWSNIIHIESNMAAARHLEKNQYDVISTRPPIDRLPRNLAGRCKMTLCTLLCVDQIRDRK